MTNNIKELQKEEAIKIIKKLTKSFDLSPNILKDFKKRKLSCSIGDYIFNISFDSRIEELIKRFENENNTLAYYCILYKEFNKLKMAILYVNTNIDEWELEREYMVSSRGLLRINAYVYNLFLPTFNADYEDITVSSIDGTLVKVD